MSLTATQLAAMRQRANEATKGPWTVGTYPYQVVARSGFVVDGGCDEGGVEAEVDALFIANARTDIPLLLDEVARLTAENVALRANISKGVYKRLTAMGAIAAYEAR